jgi:hypothetical protein
MKIKCKRPIITADGVTEIEYIFDTETLKLIFDSKDNDLLLALYMEKETQGIPELTTFEIME